MAIETEIQPIQSFEITPETLEFTTGADTRNISIKHSLCLRRTLPKTRLSQAILYENVSYTRQLSMKMESMKRDRMRNAQVLDSNRRAFQQAQKRKQNKWKKLDEIRLSNMNLPCVNLGSETERPKSCKIMYRMAEFKPEGEKPEPMKPVLPKMNLSVRREQTEIITHREKTFMTKFPEVIEIDPKLLNRHNSYCGKELLEDGGSGRDARFYRFVNALSPAKVDSADYPIENLKSYSRLYRYSNKDGRMTPRSAKLVPKSQQENLKADVARRFQAIKSRENTMFSDTFVDDDSASSILLRSGRRPKQTGRFQKRGEYILETYKSDDVIYLGKHRQQLHDDIPEVADESTPPLNKSLE